MSYGLTGSIDDFKVWNRVLAPTDISAVYWLNKPQILLPPITTSLAAYFPLSNTKTESVSGLSVTAATTVTYNTIGGRTGIVCDGTAYVANATNFIQNFTIPTFAVTSAFSVSLWFSPASTITNPTQVLFCTENSANTSFPNDMNYFSTNIIYYPPSYPTILRGITYNINTWYHYVFTINGSSTKIYLDNVLKHTITANARTSPAGTTRLSIGRVTQYMKDNNFVNPGYATFNGTIAKVAIYNKELSAAEVTTLYNAG